MISNMNNALRVGVFPPPDLSNASPPRFPFANWLAIHPLHSETHHALPAPVIVKDSMFWGMFPPAALAGLGPCFLPGLSGIKGFCINHAAPGQALPGPGDVSP